MSITVLNILSLGTKPIYDRQLKFHKTIVDFRDRLSRLQEESLTVQDIESFYDAINNFDFKSTIFSEYFQKYIDNLNRFKPQELDGTIDLTFLKIAIGEDKWKPTDPQDVFLYHIKYKYKLTSKFFLSHKKKQNSKKLNAPDNILKVKPKKEQNQNWTRVPIGGEKCEPGCGCSK